MVSKWRGTSYATPLLKQPILIPWCELQYRRASFPAQGKVRFDIRNTKATFFIPRDIALDLIRSGGQPPPS